MNSLSHYSTRIRDRSFRKAKGLLLKKERILLGTFYCNIIHLNIFMPIHFVPHPAADRRTWPRFFWDEWNEPRITSLDNLHEIFIVYPISCLWGTRLSVAKIFQRVSFVRIDEYVPRGGGRGREDRRRSPCNKFQIFISFSLPFLCDILSRRLVLRLTELVFSKGDKLFVTGSKEHQLHLIRDYERLNSRLAFAVGKFWKTGNFARHTASFGRF